MTVPSPAPSPDRLDQPFSDPLVWKLFPALSEGVDWELGRTASALARVGDPHLSYPTLHVGGTNGKGSVAATLASVLSASGLRVGLYTSPHLVHFRERFQVNGRPLSDDELLQASEDLRAVTDLSQLTFFEASTVLGFHAFARAEVDAVVVEVGLGGRLDATNVIEPVCSVLTNVALDHAEYLGTTTPLIAREKAGIIKDEVPVVTAETDPYILEIFRETAAEFGAPFGRLDPLTDLHQLEVSREGTRFTLETEPWGTLRLETPLVGRHQALNVGLAVTALGVLPSALRPSADAVRRGVASVRWPGRDQIESDPGVTWLFDVAHNMAGVLSLIDLLDRVEFPRPVVALVGVLGDKDWRSMLPPLFRRAQVAVLTQPSSAPEARRWNLDDARRAIESTNQTGACSLISEPDFAEALEGARRLASGGTVVVTGSVHTVGSAFRVLGRNPFDT